MSTFVVYRKFISDGSVVAIFPDEQWSHSTDDWVSSYMHIGQHGAASLDLLNLLEPHPVVVNASTDEYADLHRELIQQGYDDLVVVTLTDMRLFGRLPVVRGTYDDPEINDGELSQYTKIINQS